MKTAAYRSSTALALALVLLLPACSSTDDPVKPAPATLLTVTGSVGPAGGTLSTAGGEIALVVPAGALTAATELTVAETAPADLPALYDGVAPQRTFVVTPDGVDLGPDATLVLTLPWTVSDEVKIAAAYGRAEMPFMIEEEVVEEAPNLRLADQLARLTLVTPTPAAAQVEITVQGVAGRRYTVATFSLPDPYSGFIAVRGQLTSPETAPLNGAVNVHDVTEWTPGPTGFGASATFGPLKLAGFVTDLAAGDPVAPTTSGVLGDGSFQTTHDLGFTASAVGTHAAGFSLTSTYQLSEATLTKAGVAAGAAPLVATLETWTGDLLVTSGGLGGDLATGVYDVNVSAPEEITRVEKLEWGLKDTVIGAGLNGATFLSRDPQSPLQALNVDLQVPNELRYGARVTLSRSHNFRAKAAGDDEVTVLTFGPSGGALTTFAPDTETFGFSQIFAIGQNLTDATNVGGDPRSGALLWVNGTAGNFSISRYDTTTAALATTGPYWSFPGAGGGAVSAWAREGGSAVVVTDGTPGALYRHDLSGTDAAAVKIGDVGDGPRRVRVLGGIGVVSNYAGGSLSIFTWDGADDITLTDTAAVAGGPIGIDLVALPDGRVGVVSTGFGDDTWALTVVGSDGMVDSHTVHDLPTGAAGPGHATWADPEGRRALISCNTSGNVVVVDPGW